MFLNERKRMKMLFDTNAFMSAAMYLQVVLEQEYVLPSEIRATL